MYEPIIYYLDVFADSGANNDGNSSNDRPNLRFNPNAVVGKATCIQLKPSGKGYTQSVPIRNDAQRPLVAFLKIFAPKFLTSKVFTGHVS